MLIRNAEQETMQEYLREASDDALLILGRERFDGEELDDTVDVSDN